MSRGSVAVVWLWRMLWCFLDAQCRVWRRGHPGATHHPMSNVFRCWGLQRLGFKCVTTRYAAARHW